MKNITDRYFSEMYREYVDYTFMFLYSNIQDRDISLDLSSEVWIKIYNNIDKFRAESSFKTWMYKITRNTLYDYYRKNKVKSIMEISMDAEKIELLPEAVDEPEDEDLMKLNSSKVSKILKNLPINYREILTLRYINNNTFKECSEIMEISEGNAKVMCGRATKKAREYLLNL